MRKFLLLFISLFCFLARAEEYTFRKLEQSPMLYGVSINQMIEDSEGYLWMATSKGLFRYDGYALLNQHTLTPNYIKESEIVKQLQEDGNHFLWISLPTTSEYAVLTPRREYISPSDYLCQLGMDTEKQYLMHIDKEGGLWRITTDSVLHYDVRQQQTFAHAAPGLSTASNFRLSVSVYQGILYILDGRLLYIYDESDDSWSQQQLDLTLPSLNGSSDAIRLATCYNDSHGGLWIYSMFSEDILYLDPDNMIWQQISLPQDEHSVQNFIRDIAEATDGGLWIATNHRGLFLYNPVTGEMQQFEHRLNETNSLSSNNVNSLLVDSHNTLWVGFYKSGVSFYHQQLDLVRQYKGNYGDITAMLVTNGGMRWIGTEGHGLWRETIDGQFLQVEQIPNIVITDLQCARDGSIWIGTYDQGVYQLQSGFKVKHYTAAAGQLPHDGASRIALDGYDRLWVYSTFCPFYCLDIKTGKWQIYRDENGNDLMGEAICFDPKENCIILATYWGLWIQDMQTNKGYRFYGARQGSLSLHEYQENQLLSDAYEPLVWMSHSRGITVWDTKADTLYLISSNEGLTGTMLSMCQDLQHNVWVSTPSGVSVIQSLLRDDGSRSFRVRNLVSATNRPDSPYNNHSSAVSSQGRVLFGALDGYSEFDSQSALQATLESVSPGFSTISTNDSILFADVMPNGERVLHIDPDDRALKFSFYTGNPLNASDVRYSYRIQGLQDDWIETSSNSITLLSLPSGHYVFELKAIGLNAEWSEPCRLVIEVEHAWWNSTGMRIFIAFFLITIAVTLVLVTNRE